MGIKYMPHHKDHVELENWNYYQVFNIMNKSIITIQIK
jgi:hypothetical protein